MRLTRFVSLLFLVLAAMLPFGATANATGTAPAPPHVAPHGMVSVNKSGPTKNSPADTVICYESSNSPLLSYAGGGSYVVVGTGSLDSCTPHAPDSCATQVDLYLYSDFAGRWVVAASGSTNYSCPPPSQGASASVSCSTTSTVYDYYTSTVATIVYGTTSTQEADSPVTGFYCL